MFHSTVCHLAYQSLPEATPQDGHTLAKRLKDCRIHRTRAYNVEVLSETPESSRFHGPYHKFPQNDGKMGLDPGALSFREASCRTRAYRMRAPRGSQRRDSLRSRLRIRGSRLWGGSDSGAAAAAAPSPSQRPRRGRRAAPLRLKRRRRTERQSSSPMYGGQKILRVLFRRA